MRSLAALAVVAATLAACQQTRSPTSPVAGDPHRGAALIASVGCGACHDIPGVQGARGLVGPPLAHIASRTTIAGVLANTPANMIAWLRTPQAIVPGNAMPTIGLNETDARDITAYLYRLR